MADTATPTSKVTAAGLTGALTTVALVILSQVGVDTPAELASAVTVLLTVAAGYLKREKRPVR